MTKLSILIIWFILTIAFISGCNEENTLEGIISPTEYSSSSIYSVIVPDSSCDSLIIESRPQKIYSSFVRAYLVGEILSIADTTTSTNGTLPDNRVYGYFSIDVKKDSTIFTYSYGSYDTIVNRYLNISCERSDTELKVYTKTDNETKRVLFISDTELNWAIFNTDGVLNYLFGDYTASGYIIGF